MSTRSARLRGRGEATVGASGSGAAAAHAPDPLYDITPGRIWRWVLTQPPSYWLIVFYMFFEYVRPQSIYGLIYGWPLAFWSLALCGVALVVERGTTRRPWTAADTLLALFTAVVLLSCVTAVFPQLSFAYLDKYLNWVLIYVLITATVNTERRFLIFMLAYLLYCVKMSQNGVRGWVASGFSPSSYGVGCGPGFFRNTGECGIQMAMFFPVALFFVLGLKPYWSKRKVILFSLVPLSAAISMIASSSRGALLGLAAVLVWFVARNPKNLKALVGVAVLAGAVWMITPESQKERFRTMGEDETSLTRLEYWKHAREIMREYPLLGIGYGNWLGYYRRNYNAMGQLPHNIFYEAGAELGFTGLGAFIAMIVGTFWVNRKTRRLARQLEDGGRFLGHMASGLDGALVGFVVTGYFVTVLYYPYFWINLAMTVALHTSTVREVKVARRAASRIQPAPGVTGWPAVAGTP